MVDEASECPACGGSGGGPFGPPGSAWDVESYVCPRCKGTGLLLHLAARNADAGPGLRPLAKAPTKPPPGVKKPGPARVRPAAKERATAAASRRKK
jgi:hypothetical protein